MRVISGSAGGRRLKAPRGQSVRPTADRVKESLFNVLGARVADVAVLDLFCGSGQLAIEALSRGARRAMLVDSSPQSLRLARENLALTGLAALAETRQGRLPQALQQIDGPFQVVFVDPPYDRDLVLPTLQELDRPGVAAESGLIAVEHSSREVPPDRVGRLVRIRLLKFGDTLVSLFQSGGTQ